MMRHNEPNPAIEEIERAIRTAKLTGVDVKTELYLSKRAHKQYWSAKIANDKDMRVKAAFLEGYRIANQQKQRWFDAVAIGAALGIPLLVAMLLRLY